MVDTKCQNKVSLEDGGAQPWKQVEKLEHPQEPGVEARWVDR